MMRRKSFSAPWCGRLVLMTSISLLVFFGFPAILFIAAFREKSSVVAAGAVVTFFFFAAIVLLVARYYLLRGYTVSPDLLVVRRLGPDFHLDLHELVAVDVDPMAMAWTLAMSNGGLFSFGGKCWNRRLRSYEAYATDPKRSVVLRFPDRRVVVTPENPKAFADFLTAERA